MLCFSLICGLEWSPARTPAYFFTAGRFPLVYAPVGVLAFLEAQDRRRVSQRRRIQYTIASLLWAMLVTALFLGMCRTGNQHVIAILTFATCGAFVGCAVWRFHRGGAQRRLERS